MSFFHSLLVAGGYSVEYQAVLSRAITEGFTQPDTAGKSAENQLIADVKAAGIWDLFDTFHPFATLGSSGYATINWKNPSSGALVAPINSPAHTLAGFIGNATNSYLDLNWMPSNGVNYTQNSAGIYVYVTQAPTTGSAFIGHTSSSNDRAFLGSTGAQNINGSSSLNAVADLSGSGMKALIRTSSTGVTLYNETTESIRTAGSAARVAENLFILRHTIQYCNARIGFVATGGALDNTQYLALRTAINTYLTAIGV